ncbi:MAG TPA: hypothetical protein VJH94_01415 [Candidatus Paceibacterota bacterium]
MLSILLWLMNEAAYRYSLFGIWWWFDSPVHFLGGLALGAFFFWFFGRVRDHMPSFSLTAVIGYTFAMVLIVGIAWEIFEYAFHIPNNTPLGYSLDTLKDIILDVCGAAVVVWLYMCQRVKILGTV